MNIISKDVYKTTRPVVKFFMGGRRKKRRFYRIRHACTRVCSKPPADFPQTIEPGADTRRRGRETPRGSRERYWFEVSNAESKAMSLVGKSKDLTRAHASVAPWILSILPSSHSTESGPL